MKILTQGRPVKMYRRFECEICGCVFLADKKEYWNDYEFFRINEHKVSYLIYCECPNCYSYAKVIHAESEEVAAEE